MKTREKLEIGQKREKISETVKTLKKEISIEPDFAFEPKDVEARITGNFNEFYQLGEKINR